MKKSNRRFCLLTIVMGIIFLITYTCLNTVFVSSFTSISHHPYIENIIFYNGEKLFQMLDEYGNAGREAYVSYSLRFDFVAPLICGAFFTIFTLFLMSKIKSTKRIRIIAIVLGALVVGLDWLENILLIAVIHTYPEKSLALGNAAGVVTIFKSVATAVILGWIAVCIVIRIVQRVLARAASRS